MILVPTKNILVPTKNIFDTPVLGTKKLVPTKTFSTLLVPF